MLIDLLHCESQVVSERHSSLKVGAQQNEEAEEKLGVILTAGTGRLALIHTWIGVRSENLLLVTCVP